MTVLDFLDSYAYSIKLLNQILLKSKNVINVQGTFHKEKALMEIEEAIDRLEANIRTLTYLEESIRRIK